MTTSRLPNRFAVGSGLGQANGVTVYNAAGLPAARVEPFPGYDGGIRTASADFNGDGVPDLVAGTGPGAPSLVRVFDGVTGVELFRVAPFEASFTGGVYVAAGDLTGDGLADLVITPDQGGGPRVRVFSGAGFGQVADFLGIDDPNFRGGARAAVGDLNADGRGDLLVAAGFGGGLRVAGFDGNSLAGGAFTRKLFGDFFAFEETLRNGVFLAAGDVTGDGFADVLAGGGPGGGPRVSAFSSRTLTQGGGPVRVVDFFAGDTVSRNGVTIAAANLDNDGLADIVTAAGNSGRVTAYAGKALTGGNPASLFTLDTFDDSPNGVFVG